METLEKQDLKTILQQKIESKLASRQSKIETSLNKIEQDGINMADFVAPLGKDGKIRFNSNGTMYMVLGDNEYNLHRHALNQSAEKLGIPASYINELQGTDWGRKLSANILNEHTDNTKRQRLLIRTVKDQVRGVLSDSYRRLNTNEIFGNFIKAVGEQKAVIADAFADDTRSFIETINPKLIEVQLKDNIVYLAHGVRISSSDVGDGALEVRSFIMQAVCLNGLVTEKAMRTIHLGARLPDDLEVSKKTYQLDTETQSSLCYDMVRSLYSEESLHAKIVAIQYAASKECDMEKEIVAIAKKGLIAKSEGEAIKAILMNNKPEDGVQGSSSLWKLSQGISALARTTEERRSRELQEIAGSYLNN